MAEITTNPLNRVDDEIANGLANVTISSKKPKNTVYRGRGRGGPRGGRRNSDFNKPQSFNNRRNSTPNTAAVNVSKEIAISPPPNHWKIFSKKYGKKLNPFIFQKNFV